MELTFIQYLTTQVGLAGLAAMALWLNARAYQDALRREHQYADVHANARQHPRSHKPASGNRGDE